MGIWIVLCFPFLGTAIGAACVFLLRKEMDPGIQHLFTGMAGGVMVAASVWSLLIPSMDLSREMGRLRFLPALLGFGLGIFFLRQVDALISRLYQQKEKHQEKDGMTKILMMIFTITLHNLPEGAACGAILAGALSRESTVTMAEAVLFAVGIGIQNFPEGAIISFPLHGEGKSRRYSWGVGTLSGVIEPVPTISTMLLPTIITTILPYMLAFAAGAMIYVVVEELIPEACSGGKPGRGALAFSLGFAIMMILDVALG